MEHNDSCVENGKIMNGTSENEKEVLKLPDKIYELALKDIIENNCNLSENDYTISIDAGSEKGDNYIGVMYRVAVKDKNNKDVLKLIIKLPPKNVARREQFFVRPCFVRESEFYDKIFPKYCQFQEQKGILVAKDGFYEVAKCYKSLTEDLYEGLFFEDLRESGYEMFDRFKKATKEHVILVMKSIARFHAVSFAIKDQDTEWMAPYKKMVDIFIQHEGDENMKVWFNALKKQATDALKNCGNQDLIDRVEKELSGDLFQMLIDTIDGTKAEPYAILSHGDCWNNNLLFKNDQDGKPCDIRLLDWQIMRYCSPVCDIMYYIFGCTTKDLRDAHYNEFMDVYYNTLVTFMKRLGSDPEKMFPRQAFEEQLKRFGRFGLLMAIMVLPIFTSKVEDTPDMDDLAEKFKESLTSGIPMDESVISFTTHKTQDAYNERMTGVFQDMYDLKYI